MPFLALALSMYFVSCSNQPSTNQSEQVIEINSDAPIELHAQMDSLFSTYLNINKGLVKADSATILNNSFYLNKRVMDISSAVRGGKYESFWLDEGIYITKIADAITLSTTIKKQRELYSKLEEEVLRTFKEFGFNKRKVYEIHCPMAFDGKGANWLSDTSAIFDPYFGEEMLNCGEIANVYAFTAKK